MGFTVQPVWSDFPVGTRCLGLLEFCSLVFRSRGFREYDQRHDRPNLCNINATFHNDAIRELAIGATIDIDHVVIVVQIRWNANASTVYLV